MVVAGAAAGVLVAGGIALAVWVGGANKGPAKAEAEPQAAIAQSAAPSLAAEPALEVEVPHLVGSALSEAEIVLGYAGLVAEVVDDPEAAGAPGTVVAQEPEGGALVVAGEAVTLRVVPAAPDEAAELNADGHFVVVIDPGHQARSNLDLEPIGPGSSTMKEKVRGGATGVSTRIPEYETVLQISLLLRDRLRASGVEVVMTREKNDVDISNKERAEIANKAGADLFVRVHADGSTDAEVNGASVLYPSGNSWVAPIEARSKSAAANVLRELVASTGAKDRGLSPRADITGFNWSKVPAIVVECGFLSNTTEDKLLASDAYRAKVADGIAAGVIDYLEGR